MKMPARYARLYHLKSNEPMCSATGDKPRSVKLMDFERSAAACKDFPMDVQRLIRRVSAKAKEADPQMPSALDRRFDEELARVVGPGGRLVIGHDALGRAIVENFPATLP